MTRLILCCNCSNWKVLPNIELGVCCLPQEDEKGAEKIIENTTNYDSRCIYGLSENGCK